MSYNGFVRVKKNCAIDLYYWFIDNGFVASFPLALSPSLSEIFLYDLTPEQCTLCTDYLFSVFGYVPFLYLS